MEETRMGKIEVSPTAIASLASQAVLECYGVVGMATKDLARGIVEILQPASHRRGVDIEIAFEGVRDGVEVWEFELTPKPEAAVVWGRIVEQVRKRDLMPLWARYYDDRGALARSLRFEEFRTMGGRLVPARMVVEPTDKPGESTVITYADLEFDVPIDASFFSLRRLQRETGSN